MYELQQFATYVFIFQVVTDIFDVTIGAGLIYGALKWKRGLLTSVAAYWGLVLGAILGVYFSYLFETDPILIIATAVIGVIVIPILTYTIPAVNRFILGFIVTMKLLYMFTTYMCKNGTMEFGTALVMPLIIGTILGVIFMLLKRLSVLPFALGCAFLGANQVAPTIAKYINQIRFGFTQDYSLLFDPIDFIFALFKIELTDEWTLLFMIILMIVGVVIQLKYIKAQGYSYDTPLITFETDDPEMHGKITNF